MFGWLLIVGSYDRWVHSCVCLWEFMSGYVHLSGGPHVAWGERVWRSRPQVKCVQVNVTWAGCSGG